jgi:glyoxylase-like metal-dependent hydrolase (beta-lactamase superfamily II)
MPTGRDRVGVVAVDGLLQVSAAKEMRAGLDGLGKPLLAVLLTHSHPDHYAGLGEIVAGDDVPIYAPQEVIDTITADGALKDQIVGPFFGEEWPANRVFPNTAIADRESLSFDDVTFSSQSKTFDRVLAAEVRGRGDARG